jgi:hypothetical protein
MKRDNPAKHFILAFVIALLGYALVYHFIENRRTRKGPWQVTFTKTPTGHAEIVINQSTIGITNVHIFFANHPITNSPASITNYQSPVTYAFSQPKPVPYNVPFGKCVFMDTTFLPGTLTFQFFGHEIEFLPRILILDHQEHPWHSGEVVTLLPMEARTNALDGSTRK